MDFLQLGLLAASFSDRSLWGWLKYGFTQLVEFFFDLTASMGVPSYALAIFFFTIIIKLVMQPLMNKQMRSTRQMSKLQPQVKELQKKYASNPQKMQQETMKLYKEHNASPMAGCLPVLLQMPILFALFQALRDFAPNYPEFYKFFWIQAPVFDEALGIWVGGLSAPDPSGWILPVMTAGASFLQQYFTMTNREDKTQKMMLYMMPIMFGWFARSFPAFLALYWTYYSIIGGVIQVVLNKRWAKQDAEEEAARKVREEEERLLKKAQKAERKGQAFVEEDEDGAENVVNINGVDYILPQNYTLRKKKVRAHPYSEEEETVTMVVLPDGHEKPVSILQRKNALAQQMGMSPLEMFGLGKKK